MRVENVTSKPLLVINPKPPFCYYNNQNQSLNIIPRNPNLIPCRFSSRFNFDDDHDPIKRVWWSHDSFHSTDYDDFDEDEDEDEGGGFGVLQDTSFILKVFNAFGWMVPAVAISMLLGTGGTNTFLMALVLPLAQSVVSFIADTFLGSSLGSTKPKRKRAKKKPFVRARYSSEMKQKANPRKVNERYQFWGETKKRPHDQRGSSFGGWDELDRGLGSNKVPKREPIRNVNEPPLEDNGKLSRRVRTRGTPLLVRLLIAVFPFLGSWTRLL